MRCPGLDTRSWTFDDIFDVPCPECGNPEEFFKDDPSRRCRACGVQIANPRLDLGCAAHCRQADACLTDRGVSEADRALLKRSPTK